MVEINLTGAEFFAHHGYYPEEQLIGGRYVIDISVSFVPSGHLAADEIGNTINYEQLYDIACEEMAETRKLIETVAQSIFGRIEEKFPFLLKTRVCLKKLDPPLRGRVGHSSVVVSNE